jgi:large-conductance mechanosensitive channel
MLVYYLNYYDKYMDVDINPNMNMDFINNINNNFKSDLQTFIIDNNIVGTMAGVAIALYTKDLILSLSGDIVIPSIYKLFTLLNVGWIMTLFPNKIKYNALGFSRNFISWLLGVVITYIFIQIAVKYILGIDRKNEKKKEQKQNSTLNNIKSQ